MTSCRVTRLPGVMIKPSVSCPSATLNVSYMDKFFRSNASIIYVYKHEKGAPEVFKDALSKVLVPYYPLAGRLKESSSGELQVVCTGEGAWFIEAFANYNLDSVNFYDEILLNQIDHLVPRPPPEHYDVDPLVKFQLTCFSSKGFVIGITFSHILLDGIGVGQFLNAVAETCRGFPHPSIAPIWQREDLQAPWFKLVAPSSTPTPSSSYRLEKVILDVSFEKLGKMKEEFLKLTGENCSSFDIVVTSLWQNRARAIGFDQDTKLKLVFGVNARGFVYPPLPQGYYGNCIYPFSITVSSGFLVQASISELVKLIRHSKFPNLNMDDTGDDTLSHSYTTLTITDWRRLGFYKVDYGGGNPDYVTPALMESPASPLAILVNVPTPRKGIRMITTCVQSHHLQSLVQYYQNATSSRL